MLTPDKTDSRRCPYLGLEDDLTTVTDFPSLLNYCHRCRPIEVPSSLHQRTICLGSDYVRCTIFSSFNQRAMPKAMRWQHAPFYTQKIFLWSVLGTIIFLVFAGLLFAFWGDFFNSKPAQATEAVFYLPPTSTRTPTSTNTAIATKTQTPRPTSTATRIASKPSSTFTLSPTTELTLVSVSRATSCRTGTSVSFPKVGDLDVGEQAVIIGRTTDLQYWLIENPDRDGSCWIWAYYSTVTGPVEDIPIVIPPPIPITIPTATPIPSVPEPPPVQPTSVPVKPTSVPVPTEEPIEEPTPTNEPIEKPTPTSFIPTPTSSD